MKIYNNEVRRFLCSLFAIFALIVAGEAKLSYGHTATNHVARVFLDQISSSTYGWLSGGGAAAYSNHMGSITLNSLNGIFYRSETGQYDCTLSSASSVLYEFYLKCDHSSSPNGGRSSFIVRGSGILIDAGTLIVTLFSPQPMQRF